MALGRAYRIKKSAVKAYGYTKPPKKGSSSRGPRFAANGSVTHIAAINGRGSYSSARKKMSGLSANARRARARGALSSAKKKAFARKVGSARRNGSSSRSFIARNPIGVKRSVGYSANKRVSKARAESDRLERAFLKGGGPFRESARSKKTGKRYMRKIPAAEMKRRTAHLRKNSGSKTVIMSAADLKRLRAASAGKKTRRLKKATATRKATMARKTRRKKKSSARKPVARRVKRRVKRRSAKRSAVAPKRKRRKSAKRKTAKKTVLRAAPKRKRRKTAKRKTARKSKSKLTANRKRRVSRKRRSLKRNYGTSAGAKKGWRSRRAKARKGTKRRRKSRKSASVAPRRRKRRVARKSAPKRRLRRNARKATPNRRRRVRRNARRSLSPNRKRRSSKRRSAPKRRRLRRNGRSKGMFRRNGSVVEALSFVAKTGGLALVGLTAHKLLTNVVTTQILNRLFGTGAVVVATSPTTTAVAPATAGLGGLSVDPAYQRLAGSAIVAMVGVFATAKLVKDAGTRNAIMTGFALSFMHTGFTALLNKFAPQYAGMLAGPEDGTAARLSAMYGLGASIMPRYQAINGGVGEYFSSTAGLGEYFSSTAGLGEYFSSSVNGLGSLPAYEAAAGYGSNPDLMQAAAGFGSVQPPSGTNHIDPSSDLERELNIAEAAAGVGALPSYEAAAGFGSIQSVPSSSTWIPGSTDGQLWAGTRSISAPQSASEMTPAGILQTDGGQGVFG